MNNQITYMNDKAFKFYISKHELFIFLNQHADLALTFSQQVSHIADYCISLFQLSGFVNLSKPVDLKQL